MGVCIARKVGIFTYNVHPILVPKWMGEVSLRGTDNGSNNSHIRPKVHILGDRGDPDMHPKYVQEGDGIIPLFPYLYVQGESISSPLTI